MVADGRLRRLHRGVYAVGHRGVVGDGQWLAAVKACGPLTWLSHQSGAAHWNLRRSSSPIIHVTTFRRCAPAGLRVHHVEWLHPEEQAVLDGIPVTSVARTIADCAAVLPPRETVRMIEQAERLELFDLTAIDRLVARNPRRRWVSRLRAAIAAGAGEPPHVNSDWERELLDFCDDHGIPRPALNVSVEGYVVDALWRGEKS